LPDVLNIGLSGLSAAKKGIETTSHNLANANTEGYSRQRINQTTNTPVTQSGLIHGTGVRVVDVNRIHDPFLEKKLTSTISAHEYFKERNVQMEQLENIFNEVNGEGMNQLLNKFYNSFRDLANQPENETVRSVVRDGTRLIIQDFHRMRETLNAMATGIDGKVTNEITSINQISSHLAALNKKIAELEANGQETGDLRDQRDLGVRELAKSFNISTYADEKNKFVVFAKGVGPLVIGGISQELKVGKLAKADSANNMDGSVEIFVEGRPNFPISGKFSGGIVSSLLIARNEDIFKLQNKIDSIAYDFINTVNAIHRRGFINRPIEMDAEGNPIERNGSPVTGINFFKHLDSRENASALIDFSEAVKDDINNIATALEPNSPGDNRIALAISKLQHEKILNDGNSTLEEEYLSVIGNIGLETGKAKIDSEHTEGLLAQTQAIKDRLSGVSIDEETANLIRYQHSFEASAKVLNTVDKMFETVLGLGGRG